ncbi:MAG TPA: ABC transporter ATP-binding protein [Trueperaceae bacterium]|nr:ABC transporter ATP-binding protein [Trueperaceae bacterium]
MSQPMTSNESQGGAAAGAEAGTVTLEGVRVRFGGEAVLDEVDLTLPAGVTVLLRGPNGAGKSTLLRAMAGLLPFDGDIKLFGARPRTLQGRAAFAFVADVPVLFEDLTVREHATFMSRAYDRPDAEDAVLTWLERFELGDRLDEFPGTHSRGMRHKTALSLALGVDPGLLLLDEPFNTLDADARKTLQDALLARAAGGAINLLSAHEQSLESDLDARVVEVRGGHVSPLRG